MRTGKRSKRTKPTVPEYTLLANISSSSFNYYISSHGEHPRSSGDEAIIALVGDILAIAPNMPDHVGKELTCDLRSAVSYRPGEPVTASAAPMLYTVSLKKDFRSILAYLPGEVFWGLLPEFRTGKLKYIEISFSKPRYGSADLISLYFSDRHPAEEADE